jgi:molybdopterin-dependent oxidoreductase alpha subunit
MSDKNPKAEIRAPGESAAGVSALVEVVRVTLDKPGLGRGLKALRAVNQPDGFDCPGCAWPEEAHNTKLAEFCENGAKAVADEATRKKIDATFFAQWSLEALEKKSGRWLNEQGRLTQPMIRRSSSSHYEPITWTAAFELIGRELTALESPDQAAFYTSGRASNEAAFLYQLFVRKFGTNNLPDCSNLCHESSGRALIDAIGSGKGTVSLEDFDSADAIFILGQNPGSNHPRMLATLQKAKRRGAKIVSINPLDETGLKRFRNPQEIGGYLGRGTALVDLHVPVRINGDVALLKGLCKAMLEVERQTGGVLDRDFIDQHTAGFEAFCEDINAEPWETIVGASGVSQEGILEAAQIAVEAKSMICCWAMGMTQHENAVANIQQIVNFLLLRGNFGRPGAGACPVRGHSNVQGDRTMGIWEKPSAEFLDRLKNEFRFDPPQAHGLDAVETVQAMHEGRVRAFVALGGNFMAAMPDDSYTAAALRRCRLTVQISTKLNQSHITTGEVALILPTLGRSESDSQPGGLQYVTCENSMGVVAPSRGSLTPVASGMESEVRIVARMAEAVVGSDEHVNWLLLADDYDRIRERISRTIPGFQSFNERIESDGRIVLPHAVRDSRKFETSTGRANFTTHPIERRDLPGDHLLMMTIRSHDQFNTTVYGDSDRYRGIYGTRRVILINKADIARLGLEAGGRVTLTSHFDAETRSLSAFMVVPYEIPAGCAATYYPETNPLIPAGQVARGSNTPAYKSVVISVKPEIDPH